MPLDPSIFMQGAQLRQNYDKMQRDQTQNALDSIIKMKAANKKDAGDLVKLAEAAAYKKASGLELSPEEDALARGWDKIESSKVSLDPLGRPYSPRSRLFEGMAEMAPPKYNSAYAAPVNDSPFPADFVNGDMNNTADAGDFNVAQIDSMLPEHLQGVDRAGQNINQAGPIMDQNFGSVRPGDGLIARSGVSNSPAGQMNMMESGLKLNEAEETANIDASAAMAKDYAAVKGKSMAETEAKVEGLTQLNDAFSLLRADAKGTSSGKAAGLGAKVSNWLGKPSKEALQNAKFSSGKGITGLNTRIEYLKGQGTVSDSEAKQVLSMLPEDDDSYDIKMAKIDTAQKYLAQVISQKQGGKPSVAGRPGFKYLGVKQ